MNLLDLSDELLLQILGFRVELDFSLYPLVHVCTRFYAIVLPLLYNKIAGRTGFLSDQGALDSLLQNIAHHPERQS